MKKAIVFILMSSFLMFIVSCQSNNKVPDGVSPDMYKIGNEAHDIGQQYIDGELTAASTVQKLNKLYDESAKIWEEDEKNPDNDYLYDLFISGDIARMEFAASEDDPFSMLDELDALERDMKGNEKEEDTIE